MSSITSETDLNTSIAAANGGTSTDGIFQDSVTESAAPTQITSGDLALDGDNFTLTGDGSDAALTLGAGADLTIQNINIANSHGAAISTGASSIVTFDVSATEAQATSTVSAAITGSGAVTVDNVLANATSSTYAVIFDAANTYTGVTTVDGYLALGSDGSIANSASVHLADSEAIFDITGASGPVSVNEFFGEGSVYVGNNSLEVSETTAAETFSGVISDSASATSTTGGLIVESGTLELTGGDTYTGSTKVYGELVLGVGGSIADTSNVSLKSSTAVLDVSALSAVTINELTGVASSSVLTASGETLTIYEDGVAATFSGVISGEGGVDITGSSEISLAGANTYSGATVIASGSTLGISGTGSLATSGVSGAGTLDISGASGSVTIAYLTTTGAVKLGAERLILTGTAGAVTGSLSTEAATTGVISSTGAGSVQVGTASTSGTFTVTSAETYTGSTVIYGTLDLGRAAGVDIAAETGSIADSSNVSLKASGATFDITNALATTGTVDINELTGVGGHVTLGANTLDVTETTAASFAGIIQGAGGLTVDGTAALTLDGINTFQGATAIDSGAHLALAGGGSIADSSGVTVGGVFDISGVDSGTAVANSIEVSVAGLASESTTVASEAGSVVLGDNTLVISGGGTFAGVISGEGNIDITGGTLTLEGASTYSGTTTVADTATLAISTGGSISDATTISDSGAITVTDATLAATSISGTGTLLLDGGTLSIANASSAVTLGVALTGETDTANGANIASSIVLGSNTLIFAGVDTFTGVISGKGGIQIAATDSLSLTGAQTYTGSTVVTGDLTLDHATLATSNVSLKGSAELTVDASTAAGTTAAFNELTGQTGTSVVLDANLTVTETTAASYSGVISGNDSFTLAGTAALTLAGANTYTGGTTIDSGATLVLTGSLTNTAGDAVLVDNGIFTVGVGSTVVDALSGSGVVKMQTYGLTDAVTSTSASSTFSGAIHGASALTIEGATTTVPLTTTHVILSGTSDFSGGLTLEGGTVELASASAAGTGIITFGTTTSSSVLEIDNAALTGSGTSTESFGNTITQLSGGDIIDLSGLSFNSTGDASLTLTSSNELVVMEGGVSVTLTVAGITAATLSQYEAFEDSHGGTYIELSAQNGTHYHP